MANNISQTIVYANNATITTSLAGCNQILNLTKTIDDLYNFYQNNNSNIFSHVFSNISIINFNCNTTTNKYFEQIITFTKSVAIRIQVELTSIYFDYIIAHQYSLNGFFIDPERSLNLSSISLNYSTKSDACSSGEAAQDPLCPRNGSTPLCFEPVTNPWIFNCSELPTTSTISSLFTTNNNDLSSSTITTLPILTSWQIGLICGLSVLLLVILFLFAGYCFRRNSRSKRIALSRENLVNADKSIAKKGIPQGQAFQRTSTSAQLKCNSITPISWIHNGDIKKVDYINLKPSGPNNQASFIDHTKIHDPALPSTKPVYTNPLTPRINSTTTVSRPVSGTSVNQLKLITNDLQENTLNESDNISLNQSNLINPKKPSTPISRQFVDESLHDEDAWMSILAVVNDELAVLNQLENEPNPIKTIT